ncbi:MAG: hypothetical protein ACE14S_08215 [Candidatus Bathyarchaeia archaeon]
MTATAKHELTVCKGGNSAVVYLPKQYFTPGEKLKSQLEIDSDGVLKITLTKKLFNFTCDNIRTLTGSNFNIEYDKTIAGTRVFSAIQGDLNLNCTKSVRDLEPTYVTVSRRFDKIQSPKEHRKLTDFLKRLKKTFDAYIEPEGDIDALNVYKEPQRHKLKDELEAVEALHATGKKLDFSIVLRFNSKANTVDEIKQGLRELEGSTAP